MPKVILYWTGSWFTAGIEKLDAIVCTRAKSSSGANSSKVTTDSRPVRKRNLSAYIYSCWFGMQTITTIRFDQLGFVYALSIDSLKVAHVNGN